MPPQSLHPRYPRPTIIEALCEIYFALPEGQEWNASITGRFFRRIQDEFPDMEADQVIGVDVTIGPEGREERMLRPRLRTRFRHREQPLLLQLSEGIFTVNVLAPYPGWQQVRADVIAGWEHVLHEIQPAAITRIGLRYINRFPRQTADERAEMWLQASQYLAPGALTSLPGSVSRVEAHLAEHEQLIVTLGYQPPEESLAHGAVVLDLDRITRQRQSVHMDTLAEAMERLHDDVWQAFATAKGDHLEQYLREGGA
jgi:uncharacterized protein (TIGR04255 family)